MLKIFIVDDSELVRSRLAEMIAEIEGAELIGYAVSERQAIDAIHRLQPDAVMLDIRLADGNGIQVLKMIKAQKPAPVVIVLTAFPYPQYRRTCLAAGADTFIDKTNEFDFAVQVLGKLSHDLPLRK